MTENKMELLNPSDLQVAWSAVQEVKIKLYDKNVLTNQTISQLNLLIEPINTYIENLGKFNSIIAAKNSLTEFLPTYQKLSSYVTKPSLFFDFSPELKLFSDFLSGNFDFQLSISIIEVHTALQLFVQNIQTKKEYSEMPSIIPLCLAIGSLAKIAEISISGLKPIISRLQSKIFAYCLYNEFVDHISFVERSLLTYLVEVTAAMTRVNQLMTVESLNLNDNN